MESRRLRNGFTLIELVVVLLILTLTIGLIGLNLGDSDNDRVREEADRVAALLQTARDEAILQGRILAVQFQAGGYRFLRVDSQGKLGPLTGDETFRPRNLPEGMTLSLVLDGAPGTAETGLVLEPSGQIPPFTLTFRLGNAAWQARGENGGRVRSAHPDEPHAG